MFSTVALLARTAAGQETCANGWDCKRVWDGTEGSWMPVAAITRAHGPDDEVFVAYEVRNVTQADTTHRLRMEGFVCPSGDCTDTPANLREYGPENVSGLAYYDAVLTPSMGIYKGGSSSPRELHFVTRGRHEQVAPYCGSNSVDYLDILDPMEGGARHLDLMHYWWTTNFDDEFFPVEATTANSPDTDSICEDRARSSTRVRQANGRMTSCWRYHDEASPTAVDEVHCGNEDSPRQTGAYTITELDNTSVLGNHPEEHVTHVIDGASNDRVAVLRSKGRPITSNPVTYGDWIVVRMPDNPPALPIVLGMGLDRDHPDIAMSSEDILYAAWDSYDNDSPNDNDMEVFTSFCDASGGLADCDATADWSGNTTTVATGRGLRYPHIETDGARQFLVYMKDIDSDSQVQKNRVVFRTRCGTGAWSAEVIPLEPEESDWDQSLIYGHPPLSADRQDNTLHLVFAQADVFENLQMQMDDGNVVWLTHEYEDCQ